MKENKKVLILSSIVCLLPFVLSIILYDDLPQQVAIHWNSAGEPDNYAHKAIAAFGLPALLFVIHLIVLFTTTNDPKKANQSKNNAGYSAFGWYRLCRSSSYR